MTTVALANPQTGGPVRFTVNLSMLEPGTQLELAREADRLGFDAVSVGDSLFYPRTSSSTYPYTASGDRTFIEGKPFADPLVLASALLASTKRISFQTSVLKLGVRHPVVVAKQVASLGTLFPGRFRLGVGSSPWPEDFEVLGLPYAARGKLFAESIEVVRALLAGGYASFDGEVLQVPEIRMDPVPAVPVPILVGGHGPANLRRAAELGDGWIAATSDLVTLEGLITDLRGHRAASSRAAEAFRVHASAQADRTRAGVGRLAQLGVTDVSVRPSATDPQPAELAQLRDDLARTAEALLG